MKKGTSLVQAALLHGDRRVPEREAGGHVHVEDVTQPAADVLGAARQASPGRTAQRREELRVRNGQYFVSTLTS